MCRVLATCALATVANAQSPMTPAEALDELRAGNRRFVAGEPRSKPLGEGIRRSLARGHRPFAVVVTCADSRVPPEHVFDTGLGEIVVVRVAGNVCDPETLATIEHAAEQLGVPLCVVMSHEKCDQIAGAVTGRAATPAQRMLHERIDPALRRARHEGYTGADLLRHTEIENCHETIDECLRRSAVLRDLVRLRRMRMVGAHYTLTTGEVRWLPQRPFSERGPATADSHAPLSRPDGVPPHVALAMLHAGHRRYLRAGASSADVGARRRADLAHGQKPQAIVVTCADSRVSPELIFDCGLGDIYVVRVAGGVATDTVLASVEYALGQTGASLLVVMGHDDCDAVANALRNMHDSGLSPSMRALVDRLTPAVKAARAEHLEGAELVRRAGELNALGFLGEIRRRSGLVSELESLGQVALVPVVYEVATGDLRWLDGAATAAHGHAAPPGGHGHGNHPADTHDPRHGSIHGGHAGDDHGQGHDPAHGDEHGQDHGDAHGHAHPHAAEHDPMLAPHTGDEGHEAAGPGKPGGPGTPWGTLIIACAVAISGTATILMIWKRSA